jgi:hypothetical protein
MNGLDYFNGALAGREWILVVNPNSKLVYYIVV